MQPPRGPQGARIVVDDGGTSPRLGDGGRRPDPAPREGAACSRRAVAAPYAESKGERGGQKWLYLHTLLEVGAFS
jgi:hypothetical protein